MSKFGKVAILAAKRAQNGMVPQQAWEQSTEEVFPDRPASRDKGCPRYAFLGLAEEGLIVGIRPGDYTNSQDNKRYAVAGVRLLKNEPHLCTNVNKMWRRVMRNEQDKNKQHNEQMDVVAGLWKNGYIRHSV